MLNVMTPPKGWNSWNTFGPDISEQMVMETADRMAADGYKDAGYEYIIIDDCWAKRERGADGRMEADTQKFPHGIKYLTDYIHAKGLKFGIYSCAGVLTCAGYPGSFGREYLDADTFASWGVDYLKYDFCNHPSHADPMQSYLTMANALRSCGRDILYAACNWGHGESWHWMRSIGAHTFRSDTDIRNSFASYKAIIERQLENFALSGPGCFNDIDMMICGMKPGAFATDRVQAPATFEEHKTHFAYWCMLSAPLIMGCDLRDVDEDERLLMQNPDLLAINADPDARPPVFLHYNDERPGMVKMMKLLADGDYAIAYFNMTEGSMGARFMPSCAGFPIYSGVKLELRDLFTGEVMVVGDSMDIRLAPHCCAVYRARVLR